MIWPSRRLADVLAEPLSNGRSVPTQLGGFPVLRLTALRDGGVDLTERKGGAWTAEAAEPYLVHEDDFFISRGNGSLALVGRGGLVAGQPDPVAYPDTMIRARPDPDIIFPRYLSLVWKSPAVRVQVESAAKTTAGIYKVNQANLRAVTFPVPPLSEQRLLVDLIDNCFFRLDLAAGVLTDATEGLRRLQDRLVLDAITGEGCEGTRVPARLDDVGTTDGTLPDLPEGWTWARLGEIADVVGGVTKDSKKQDDVGHVDVPYLRVANVQRGRLDLDSISRIRVSPSKAEALRLEVGDVLLNEGGDRDKLARGWVWNGQIDHCIHQNHVFRARIRDKRVDPYLLSYTANTIGARWAERNGKQSVNLASISLSMIRRMPVIVPAAGAAEIGIARLREKMASIGRLRDEIQRAEERNVALRRAVLAAAFSGGLSRSLGERRALVGELVGT